MRTHSIQTTLPFTQNENTPDHWGDQIHKKDKNTFRIYFQNINGIQPNQIERWENIVHTTTNIFNSDLVGLCETGLNWQKYYLRTKLQQAIRSSKNKNINIIHSKNTASSTTSFLPGGTLLLTKDNWTGRIVKPLSDPAHMGRWSGAKYRLQNKRHLYLISAYRPCPSPPQHMLPQSNSTFAQQYFKLRQQGNSDPRPREQFVIDLIQYLHELNIDQNDMVLVMFDANEQLGKEKNGIIQLIEKAGLVDIFTVHQNIQCNIATQAKGSQRIDYMLGTPNIIPYIHKCGYLPFQHKLVTDHRGMFLDISNTLLDVKIQRQTPSQREIGSHSTMIHTLKYKEYILKQFLNHNIRDRTEVLYEQANKTAEARPRDFEKNLNQVDKQITEILLKAEKKFAVDPLQRWINNATIRHMYKVIKYWQTMTSAIKHKKDFNTSLNNLKKQLPAEYLEQLKQYDSTPTLGLSNIRKELRKQKDLQLQEMRDQEATESAMIAQAEYKSSMHIEQRRSQVRYTKTIYASLRNRFRPPHTLGLTSVIVPTNNGEGVNKEEVITNPYEVENHIINRNIEHFGQAQGTPFTSDKITKMLGYTGVSQQANNIIQGANIEELIQNMGPGEQKILRQLNNGKNTPTISITITQKEFMTGFRKWRESTSTSPSGRHLGHCKALLRAELIDNQPVKNKHKQKKPITNNPKGVEIFKPIYQTAIAALQAGVSLIRWKQVQSSMIEKDPGKPYLHRLRVIHLYEADYNLLLKILWSRKLTWKAHIDGSLHESQAGSRPGRRAIDLVVFKEQKYLYSRLTRTTVLTMDNDAKACYDRIICNLAMLISQYFGMPENACNMQANTIKDMEFKLKTALGVSTQHYKHSPTTPVHGSGQGSCASPTLWLLISSILMRCLENGAPGMELYPIEKTGNVIRSTIDGFVYDTSLFTNLPFNQHSLETAVNNLQSTTQLWAQLLEASGGKLELQKCFYYVLKWNFTSDGEPIPMSIAEQAAANITPITIKDSFQNKNIPIQQKECNSHHKTLGVYKNMLGDETYQCEILAQKSYNLAQIVNSSHMSKQQARLAYTMIYIPTITYSLAACSYTLQQAGKIQAKALDNFLPVMGWRRTSARALVHGPLELGGINVPHLYAIQGATKLMTLFNHIRGKTALGLLLITNINWVQLISGKGSHILSATDYILYIHNNWILNPQEYMHTCYLTIKTNIFWLPSLQRVQQFP